MSLKTFGAIGATRPEDHDHLSPSHSRLRRLDGRATGSGVNRRESAEPLKSDFWKMGRHSIFQNRATRVVGHELALLSIRRFPTSSLNLRF